MHTTPKRQLIWITLGVCLALLTAGCGALDGARDIVSGDEEADVTVGAVQSGCAAAIDLAGVLNGAPSSALDTSSLERLPAGIAAIREEFDTRPADVDEYLDLTAALIDRTIDASKDRDNPTEKQILLLLDVERAERQADFDRLAPEADRYFSARCGAAYSEVDALEAPTTSVVDPETTTAAQDPANGATTSTTTVAEPEPYVSTKDNSKGANGVYLSMEIEVEDIVRTNLTPRAAVTDGDTLGETEIVMVGIRVTSTGASIYSSPSDFGWVDADGIRTNATGAISSIGTEWSTRADTNESKSGFLVFPATVGETEGASLQIGGGETMPETIPLGAGAASSTYPVVLAAGQTGEGVLTNGTSSVCEYPSTTEVRTAEAALEATGQHSPIRADDGARFIRLTVAVEVLEVTGAACDWATSAYGNLTNIRLRMNNGDVVAPLRAPLSFEVGTVVTTPLDFAVPADVTSFELLTDDGSVVATWTDISLPEA